MAKKYRYQLSVTCRQRGAEGVFGDQDFDVLMPKEWNTPTELFDQWVSKHGDRLQPGIMGRINGEYTLGMHGHQFCGQEVSDAR